MGEADNTKLLKKLTLAIWVLCALTFVNIIISLFSAVFPLYIAKRATAYIADEGNVISPDRYMDKYDGFHDWPVEKQIEGASVIALTVWEKDETKLKCIIKEILKIEPETTFYYNLGQEYTSQSRYPKENTSYGDGEIIFFTGSPASMRYSTTYKDGRILGMGDMPIEILREKISKFK